MIEDITKLISCFVSGMSDYRLYPDNHQSVTNHAAEAIEIIKTLNIEHFFTITVNNDNSMLINGVRVSLSTPDLKKFYIRLRHKGIVTIIISKGLRVDELERFFGDLASSGNFFHPYGHIAVKKGDKPPLSEITYSEQPLKDDIFQVKQIYRDISIYGSINMTSVDAVIGNIIANVRQGRNILDSLIPLNGDAEDLYIHSFNVSTLSIAQCEYLGFGNALLYDIGFSALLHDVGKMLFPRELLDRQYALMETDWRLMKKHPEYGAALLSSLKKVPEIAIVVAYEHHMKYDGTGYPEIRRTGRKQHVFSQIVSISDFYCTLSAELPHRKHLNKSSIIGILLEKAGTEFNPLFISNFIRLTDVVPY